jgi:peptidoglycan/LPS O-acetylase OafA/YrhL
MPLKRLSFIPQLDSFRFFSVLIVILYHWVPGYNIFHFADVGVGFFFVLSGYLISSNLLYLKQSIEKDEITPPGALLLFYYRRALRIFPLYYLVIFLLFLSIPAVFDGHLAWYLFYSPNLLFFQKGQWPGMLSHFWSLGVEEQFYLLWPMLIFCVPWRRLQDLFILTVLASILFKAYFVFFHPYRFLSILPFSQFDVFGMGALLAYLPFSRYASFLDKRNTRLFLFIGCFLLAAFARNSASLGLLYNLGLSGCGLLIIFQAQKGFRGFAGKILNLSILQYLGKISYGLYVYHPFMPWLWRCLNGTENKYPLPIALFTKSWMSNAWVNQFSQLSLLLIIASLSWFLFEKPINNLKNARAIRKQGSLEPKKIS